MQVTIKLLSDLDFRIYYTKIIKKIISHLTKSLYVMCMQYIQIKHIKNI